MGHEVLFDLQNTLVAISWAYSLTGCVKADFCQVLEPSVRGGLGRRRKQELQAVEAGERVDQVLAFHAVAATAVLIQSPVPHIIASRGHSWA